MRKITFFILSTVFMLLLVFVKSSFATDPLIQPGSLTYMGAFRVPYGDTTAGNSSASFQYGGAALAYNPANNSLFAMGNSEGMIAEINIPTPKCLDKNGDSVSCSGYSFTNGQINGVNALSSLNSASYLQTFTDDTYGNSYEICTNSNCSGNGVVNNGILVYNGTLIGNTKAYYDASYRQVYSHFTNSTNLSTDSFSGYYELNTGLFAGYAPGPMAAIPSAYQSQLGGTVLTGQGPGVGIVTSLSYGPCAIAFDPANLTSADLPPNAVPASVLSYYNSAHSLPGGYWAGEQQANPYTSPSDVISGVVFPDGTRSVLYLGLHGEASTDGYSCYGPGTPNLSAAYSDGCPGGAGTCQESKRLDGFTGAVTSGAFIPGETVTQAGTNATGTLVRVDSTYGLEFLASAAPEGANATGVWTGQTSGAAFTPNSSDPGDMVCYDPSKSSKGTHAYPYVNYVWSYDVGDSSGNNTTGNNVNSLSSTNPGNNNLTAVKLGIIKPYEVVPYATWTVSLPTGASQLSPGNFGGAAWDPVHRLLYVAQMNADQQAYSAYPVIHVFNIPEGNTIPSSVTGLHLVQ